MRQTSSVRSTTRSPGATSRRRSATSARIASSTSPAPPAIAGRSGPYFGHDGLREYFRDVERVWQELVLHTEDIRVIPGSVIVIGHVTGRRQDLDVRRSSVWTWRVKDGRATSVKVADLGDLA